jgi:hypothetical protein
MPDKICPFCHKEIGYNFEKCPECGCLLVEHINLNQNDSYNINQSSHIIEKIHFINTTSRSKFIGYFLISLVIFFIILISLGNESLPTTQNQTKTNTINSSTNTAINYNSLPNGTIIYSSSPYLTGEGELNIDNGTDYDTVVKLIRTSTNTSIDTVYIKAKNSYKIDKILDGSYTLLFMHGKGWDDGTKTFLAEKSYSKFVDNFNFITTEITKSNGIYDRTTIFEVTLHPVYGGTARTDGIPEEEFSKY